jgi:hypothetical protein
MSNKDGTGVPVPKPEDQENPSGRNRNRFQRNRRGFNNNNRYQQRQNSRFEGREPSLKGHIYNVTGERNPDQYIKTTKEIVNYVGRTYTKFTSEFITAVMELELDDPEAPDNPDPRDQVGFELWKLDIKEHRLKLQEYANFRAGLFNVVFGQCTESLQDKLKSHENYNAANQDGIELLALIKEITYTLEEQRILSDALCDVKEQFYTFKQGRTMSLQRYHELFLAQAEVLDQVGVTIEDESLVEAIATNNLQQVPNDADRNEAREQALAVQFICGTNDNYKSYVSHLRNSFLEVNDNYPRTLHQAYNILQRREMEHPIVEHQADGMAFTNKGVPNDDNDNSSGRNRDHITCLNVDRLDTMPIDVPIENRVKIILKVIKKETHCVHMA